MRLTKKTKIRALLLLLGAVCFFIGFFYSRALRILTADAPLRVLIITGLVVLIMIPVLRFWNRFQRELKL